MQNEFLITVKKKKHYKSVFGQKLREIRQARGFSQIDLGKRVGISQRMMGHYEMYAQSPPAEIVAKLAKALKVSTDELLGVKPFKDSDLARSRNIMRRFQKVDALPLRDQRTVFSLINALKAKQASKRATNGSS